MTHRDLSCCVGRANRTTCRRPSRAVAHAYGLDRPPSATDLTALAAAWRPYRTWATVLLRAMLDDETHEIAGGARRSRGTVTEE